MLKALEIYNLLLSFLRAVQCNNPILIGNNKQ